MVTSFNAATRELGKLPAMKDDDDDAKDASAADIQRKIDGIPAAKPILARHGFTSQTYALTLLAYFQAAFHLGMEPSMDKKGAAELLAGYSKETRANIEMLRKNGLANFRTLLLDLSRDPAMIYWLDNNENHAKSINENYGREILGLFSMGIGNYTEQDIKECARAFTGWTFEHAIPLYPYGHYDSKFVYNEADHDNGVKTFLGHTGNFNGEDIVNIIAQQEAAARFEGIKDEYLRERGVIGLEGIDTRALVRRIRVHGAMTGVLSSVDLDDASLIAKAQASPGLVGRDLVKDVMPAGSRDWQQPLHEYLNHPATPRSIHAHQGASTPAALSSRGASPSSAAPQSCPARRRRPG